MNEAIQKMIGRAPSGNPSDWVSVKGVGGYITSVTVAGQTITPSKFFDNLWGLYSPYITSFTYNTHSQTWVAHTSGNGHGIGMSHLGAIAYTTRHGWSYQQVLTHYYQGATFAYGSI